MPFVTVVVPTKDRPSALARAVGSVLRQSFAEVEVIVVDDGSAPAALAENLRIAGSDPRVRLIRRPASGGPSRARNDGIWAARGRWLCCLDDDDELLPGKIEEQVSAVECWGGGDVTVVTGIEVVWPSRTPRVDRLPAMGPVRVHDLAAAPFRISQFLNTYMAPTAVLREIGGYDPELRWGEHTDLLFRLRHRVEFVLLPVVGTRVHRHFEADHAGQDLERRSEGIRRLLVKHDADLRREPGLRSTYLGVLGISELRLGRRGAAVRSLASAWLARPTRVRTLGQLVVATVGGRTLWRGVHAVLGEHEPM